MHLAILAIGLQEMLPILIIVLLLFGATKIPQLMRGMGQGIKEFKEAVKEDEPDSDTNEDQDLPTSEDE